jgi:hypothetical protein
MTPSMQGTSGGEDGRRIDERQGAVPHGHQRAQDTFPRPSFSLW